MRENTAAWRSGSDLTRPVVIGEDVSRHRIYVCRIVVP
jgi:hypothetical protein